MMDVRQQAPQVPPERADGRSGGEHVAKDAWEAELGRRLRALGQEGWVDALAPPAATFSPLKLLEQRRGAARQERSDFPLRLHRTQM